MAHITRDGIGFFNKTAQKYYLLVVIEIVLFIELNNVTINVWTTNRENTSSSTSYRRFPSQPLFLDPAAVELVIHICIVQLHCVLRV